jgi:hypothetical protein
MRWNEADPSHCPFCGADSLDSELDEPGEPYSCDQCGRRFIVWTPDAPLPDEEK